jgi:hypothetical protein
VEDFFCPEVSMVILSNVIGLIDLDIFCIMAGWRRRSGRNTRD